MRNQKYTKITIDGVSYSEYLRLPLTVQQTLNEQLDSAVVDLFNVPFAEPLKPFSRVVVGGMPYLLAEDSVTENFGRKLYKHSLTLIEETKEAERIICGAKAFTWAMMHSYTGSTVPPTVEQYSKAGTADGNVWWNPPAYEPTYRMRSGAGVGHLEAVGGTIRIPTVDNLPPTGINFPVEKYPKAVFSVYFHPEKRALVKEESTNYGNAYKFVPIEGAIPILEDEEIKNPQLNSEEVSASQKGVYTVFYQLYIHNEDRADEPINAWLYDVKTVMEAVEKPKATIKEVVEKLLDTCETIRKNLNRPRYKLVYTGEQAGIMNTIAPEFHFANGRSLWENLREIGKYIHAIPRITGDELTFDLLGSTEYADLSKGQRVAQTSSLNISDYTAGLDTMANNLVNMDDEADGSITEPFDNGYVTMRATEDEARIQEGTGILLTTYPVEKLLKLELGAFTFVDGKDYPSANLTPFVFEKSEYDLLSSFSGSFPDSKTYALYYTQGSKNISGFWYKANDSATDIGNVLKEYSITNIIEAATGVNAGFFKNLPYTDLKFRITYIPSVTARVRQYKPDYDGRFPSVMVHNQSANKLSASALGQNLRGQLAMMSNVSDTVTYMFKRMEDLPRAGTLYDDNRYIASITARVYNDFVVAQMALSENFNELGAFVETNNAIRQFEIPAGEDRYTVLEEFCMVSETTKTGDLNTAALPALRSAILHGLSYGAEGKDASLAFVRTFDDDGEILATVALPVTTLAVGTSLYFGFRFDDNFSAGRRAVSKEGAEYKYQEYVPYGDEYYAEAHSLSFYLLTGAVQLEAGADSFPSIAGVHSQNATQMVSVPTYSPIIWHKDSADAGCVTYQLHMVTDSGLILGDGLTYFCEAVRKSPVPGSARMYFYDHRINQLTGTTDENDVVAIHPISIDEENGKISHTGVPTKPFKSWAIIKNGRFIMGKNSSEVPTDIYFTFKRRLKS